MLKCRYGFDATGDVDAEYISPDQILCARPAFALPMDVPVVASSDNGLNFSTTAARFTFRNGSSHPTISSYSPIYGKRSKRAATHNPPPPPQTSHLPPPTSPFSVTTHLSHAHSHTFPPFPPSLLSPPLLQKALPPAGRSSTYAAPTLRHTRIFTVILAGYAQVQPSNPGPSSAAHPHRSSTKASRQAA